MAIVIIISRQPDNNNEQYDPHHYDRHDNEIAPLSLRKKKEGKEFGVCFGPLAQKTWTWTLDTGRTMNDTRARSFLFMYTMMWCPLTVVLPPL